MRTRLIALLLVVALASLAAARPSQAQGGPAFVNQGGLGVNNTKFPSLAGYRGTIHFAGNRDLADAIYATRAAVSDTYGAFERVGLAQGQPDYSSAHVAVGSDGKVYYTWVNQTKRTIYFKARTAQGWGPLSEVVAGQPFPVNPVVAVTRDNAITVVWRNPDQPFRWRRSTDGGTTWSSTRDISSDVGIAAADLAVSPAGELSVAFTGSASDRLQVFVATWTGAGFSTPRRVSRLDGDYANPSLSYGPDGKLYVAWRGTAQSGGTAGVFFAERQGDGSYTVARVIDGRVEDRVSIEADVAGNLHVVWTAAVGTTKQVWYTTKPRGLPWQKVVGAPPSFGIPFNAYGAVALAPSGALFAHAVSEIFVGENTSLRGYRFSSGLTATGVIPSARPTIEQDAPRTRSSTLSVKFDDVFGSPSELRYRWGSAPTDTDPWVPFAEAMSVEVPPTGGRCVPVTLFTQVRGAGGLSDVASDTITHDAGVQVSVEPFEPDAAPGYTNLPSLIARISDNGECSGLVRMRPLIEGAQPFTITTMPHLMTMELPDVEGPYQRAIELSDQLGNTGVVSMSVVYDRTAPSATYPITPTITPGPAATIVQTISVRGATYSDGEGSETLPWAVAVQVSRSPNALAADGPWTLLPLDGYAAWELVDGKRLLNADLTLDLSDLLPADQLTPGAYYYVLGLADWAGNRASAFTSTTVTLERISYPPVNLPLIRR